MADQVKYTNKLHGQKVLVIGGSSGIGYSVAEALVENQCTVIVSSSNPSRVDTTVQRLQSAYPSATTRISGHACNLGDEASLESNVVALLDATGKLDHIIYTAGDVLAALPLDTVDVQKAKQAAMVRFFGPLMVAKHAPKVLSAGPNSSITLTSGSVSQKPIPNWTVIGSFATALQGMTRGLALDLKPIRVNLISPGAVNTELWQNSGMTDEQIKTHLAGMEKRTLTGVCPGPEEIAEAYLYCLRDRNVTGTMISTSSGALLL